MESQLDSTCAGNGCIVNELVNGINDQLNTIDKTSSAEKVELNVDNIDDYGEFPVCVEKNEILGRYLVAKRDISAGEIILRDKPIFMGPNAGDSDEASTCLGCCVQIKSPVPCPKCGWHLCALDCENIQIHTENECEYFSKNEIKPELPSPYCFIAGAEYIKVLRCLLLSLGRNPEDKRKWDLLHTLEAHVEMRKSVPKILFMSNLSKLFIKDLCKLDQIDGETVDFILGVVDVNAFRHVIHPDNPLRQTPANHSKNIDRNATFMYPRAAMAAHGCRRNVRWETLPNGNMEMWAAEDVKKGQTLTHPYIDLMLGTPDRRRQLKDQFYFDCSCERCSDPTELGTYFSALKCPECKTGYLLAVDPLDYETKWKCNKTECHCEKSNEYERNLVTQMQSEVKTTLQMMEFGSTMAVVSGLARILGKYQGKKVHFNHYAIVDIEYNLVKQMARMSKQNLDVLQEMKRMIHKFLNVANVFYPGIK